MPPHSTLRASGSSPPQWTATARIWDARTGEPIGKPLQHENTVDTGAFDPKGERIVTASADNTARIWDARTGEPIGKPLQHECTVNTAAFDPRASGSSPPQPDKTARIWDARTGEPIGKPLQHERADGSATARRFRSSKGERIVTASADTHRRGFGTPHGRAHRQAAAA